MRALLRKLATLAHDSRGATAVEYGFILAMIVLAIMAALVALARVTNDMWGDVSTKVEEVSRS